MKKILTKNSQNFFVLFLLCDIIKHMDYSHKFEVVSKFTPSGDQPKAIKSLVDGINDGLKSQVLVPYTSNSLH